MGNSQSHDVIVIGGGQSGLAAGYHLRAADIDHLILERAVRVGDVWRSRYDSLKLYSPARFDALPGLALDLALDLAPSAFPSGGQMAEYLERYAQHFELPVRTATTVERLRRLDAGRGYEVVTDSGAFHAPRVIIATGPFHTPFVPTFAGQLDPAIVQVHSADYRQPADLPAGPVLVVGASHSGADIAYELATTRQTYLSGRAHGQLPFSVDGRVARVTWPLMRSVASKLLSLDTPIGRKMAPQVRMGGGPLLRHRRQDLARAGVEWIEHRTVGVAGGKPELADGRVLDVAGIVWCTGFRPDYSWIEPSITGDDGWPTQVRGVVTAAPGLYVLGTPFLHSFASMLVTGAGDDARFVVDHIRTASLPVAA